ncbi:MAG: iron ABC transporter permease [Meiothermus sp.]
MTRLEPQRVRQLTQQAGVFATLLGLLGLGLWLGLSQGAVTLAPEQVLRAVLGLEPNPIVAELRLPRVLGSMLVGAALGLAGALFQGLFRNPLADPYLMGSASGAAFAVTVALSLSGGLSAAYASDRIFAALPAYTPVFAFGGAVLAVALTLLLAGGAARTHDLVLAGVVVGSVLTGLTTYWMLKDADRVRAVMAYTLGNLSFMGWPEVRVLALYLLAAGPLWWVLGRTLNALSLGEETARSLGLPLAQLKLGIIGLATWLTAASVAYAGIIGFVGLVAPHALRRLVGGDYRVLLPASALGGAVLLSFSDLLARVLTRPAELPVGVVTTLLGGPFFLYLLWRGRRDVH